MLTTFLVDYERKIASVNTNGICRFDISLLLIFFFDLFLRLHDSMSSLFFEDFRVMVGRKNFTLGDPGYAGNDYVVAGLKSNQVTTPEAIRFDEVTRTEQVIIEHINRHVKSCRVLSKSNQFHHGRDKHVCCVFIVSGWYNYMRQRFGKFT